ncbi:hypothetical protein RUND412_007432 [Rhizina undulata]
MLLKAYTSRVSAALKNFVLKKVKALKARNAKKCPLCLKDISIAALDTMITVQGCGHTFCDQCLYKKIGMFEWTLDE